MDRVVRYGERGERLTRLDAGTSDRSSVWVALLGLSCPPGRQIRVGPRTAARRRGVNTSEGMPSGPLEKGGEGCAPSPPNRRSMKERLSMMVGRRVTAAPRGVKYALRLLVEWSLIFRWRLQGDPGAPRPSLVTSREPLGSPVSLRKVSSVSGQHPPPVRGAGSGGGDDHGDDPPPVVRSFVPTVSLFPSGISAAARPLLAERVCVKETTNSAL